MCIQGGESTPDAKTLVSGELLVCNPSTGAVKIRYTSDRESGWDGRVSSGAFARPRSVEMKGKLLREGFHGIPDAVTLHRSDDPTA